MVGARSITVRYESIDGFTKRGTFKTVEGASAFARKWVGDHPEQGRTYAVSGDGVGKITCSGCTLTDLFPAPPEPVRRKCSCSRQTIATVGCACYEFEDYENLEAEYSARERKILSEEARALEAAERKERMEKEALRRAGGCTCSDQQLNLVGCDCEASMVWF